MEKMAKSNDITKIINSFYGGIVRDDKSNVMGACSNIEEVDIFSNKDWVQAEQIMTSDTLPTGTEIYAYCNDDSDYLWFYGKETVAGKVRLGYNTTGGADNPGSFATAFTSADATNLATLISPICYHKTSESNTNYVYYIAGASVTWYLKRYDITAGTESSVGQLTGLNGSFDRPVMKRFYGNLYILHGQFVAKVDDTGTFTEKAFTLPKSQKSVDIIPVSDVSIILTRNVNKYVNETVGYWWDLSSANTFDDRFVINMGGGQWISNWREKIIVFCAANGIGRFYQLASPNAGAQVIELPGGRLLTNIGVETSTQPISSPKMLSQKDGILYFGVLKTDKTGIYALGQLDFNSPVALILSKRFATSDYSLHKPTALLVHASNYYGAFNDGTNNLISRCAGNNSPARSSNAIIETLIEDFGTPIQKKELSRAYLIAYPLTTSTSLDLYVAPDFGSYTQIKRADNSVFNTLNGLLGLFRPTAFNNKYVYKAKVAFTSNGVNSPKLRGIGLRAVIKETE